MRAPALLAACLALSGCSLVPDFTLPEIPLPAAWANAGPGAPPPAPQLAPPAEWWRAFGQDELNALQQAALAHNRDLAAAVARIAQAQAQAGIAGAPLWPSLDLGADGGIAKQARTATTATTTRRGGTTRSYQGRLSASYELDFWGANRAALEAAEHSVAASAFARDTVALTLTADVAATWFQALALTDRIGVARRNLGLARETLAVAETQYRFGKTSALEAAQQRSAVAQIEAQLPALELQRTQAVDALAVLTGRPPSALALAAATLAAIPVPEVAPGLPASVLHRRPDIRQAEAALLAANADIGAARARLFPSVVLTADRGYASSTLSALLQPGNAFWSLGAGLTAPLFDGGARRGAVDLSQARLRELAAQYQGTALAALRDVEDGLAALRYRAEQEQAQQAALEAAREAERLASVRYREGAVDYLTVLEAQRTLLQAEDGAVQVRQARLEAAVGLYRALAGSPFTAER